MENTYMNYDVEHPGVFLRDELEERGWLQSDLAYILGCPVQSINTIISGKRGITVDMARSLEKAFDVPADFFLNLQKLYDLSRASEPDAGIEKKAKFFRNSYPIREMFKRGWIEDAEPDLLEAQMMRFFEVETINDIPHMAHVAKKTRYDDIPTNQLTWLFRVRQIARFLETPVYSKKKLESALRKLRNFMEEPEEIRHVPKLLTEAGVRFIIVESLPNAKIDGVCFWLNSQTPVIGMSIRYDRIDNFWFVLRHEIEHVLRKHGLKRAIIDTELLESDAPVPEEESIANDAASDFCVPKDKLTSFIARKHPYISERDILGFASKLRIHPGIAVGQIHHKTKDYRLFRKYLIKIRTQLEIGGIIDGWGTVVPINL